MYVSLLGAALGLASAQDDRPPAPAPPMPPPMPMIAPPAPPSPSRRLVLPFDTGQLRIAGGADGMRQCTGRGRGYEAAAASLCPPGEAGPPPAPAAGEPRIETAIVIGFTRAGEQPVVPVQGPGRRLYDVEAEIQVGADGAVSACRIVRADGAPAVLFGGADVCEELRRDQPLFAPATGSGLRHGRLRISFFMDAPPAVIERMLRPPPPMVVSPPIMSVPPPPPMIMVAPPPPPPPPPRPPSAAVSRPEPVNRNGWISTDDYPAAALRAEDEGTVAVRLEIDARGRVSNCTITSSSGATSLDSATCRLFRSRARYRPARNAAGEPVPAFVGERVRWVLPDSDPIPFEPAYAALSVTLVGDRMLTCATIDRSPEDAALSGAACGILFPDRQRVPRAIGQGLSALRIAVEVSRDGRPRPPFVRQRGRAIFAVAARFTVQPDGMLTACEARVIARPRMPDAPPFDLCAVLQRPEFHLFYEGARSEGPQAAGLTVTVLEGGAEP